MEPDRRNQISDLYHAALERPAEERSAFVQEACEGDEAVRQEAETESLGPFESNAMYAGDRLIFVRGGALMAQPFDPSTRKMKGQCGRSRESGRGCASSDRGVFSMSGAGALAYSHVGRTVNELLWFDRKGQSLGTTGEPGFYVNLDLSPDDRRLAASVMTEQPDGYVSPGSRPDYGWSQRVMTLSTGEWGSRIS